MNSVSFRLLALCALFTLFGTGCSVLVGSVKPVEERQDKNFWTDVVQMDPDFKRLNQDQEKLDTPDAAWQSKTTAAIISINSACRTGDTDSDVTEVTTTMLSQWTALQMEYQKSVRISGIDGMDNKGVGTLLGKKRAFRTIVVKSSTCIYDLSLLSPPDSYAKHETIFEKFRDSLRLK